MISFKKNKILLLCKYRGPDLIPTTFWCYLNHTFISCDPVLVPIKVSDTSVATSDLGTEMPALFLKMDPEYLNAVER